MFFQETFHFELPNIEFPKPFRLEFPKSDPLFRCNEAAAKDGSGRLLKSENRWYNKWE